MPKLVFAVVTPGQKNVTRVTNAVRTLDDRVLDAFARQVAEKDPTRNYYVVPFTETIRGPKKIQGASPLFSWHVGEGFKHDQGWWVRSGEEE